MIMDEGIDIELLFDSIPEPPPETTEDHCRRLRQEYESKQRLLQQHKKSISTEEQLIEYVTTHANPDEDFEVWLQEVLDRN